MRIMTVTMTVQKGRGVRLSYLIFVTGATGGTRVKLAKIGVFRCKFWCKLAEIGEKLAKIGVFRCKFYSPKILPA